MKTRSFWRKNFHELEFLKSQKQQLLDNEVHKGSLNNQQLSPKYSGFRQKKSTICHLALPALSHSGQGGEGVIECQALHRQQILLSWMAGRVRVQQADVSF